MGEARILFLKSLIGVPYAKNAKGPHAYDCWHLTVHVQDVMFGRRPPNVDVPEDANWRWMIDQFTGHPELGNWVEVLQPNNGLITANDGAIVLMARSKQPAHCGTFLKKEQSILHADTKDGVVLQQIPILRAESWTRLKFYEPK